MKQGLLSDVMEDYSFFDEDADTRSGRIDLPVAPECNIHCKYCVKEYDCANESKPGASSRVLTTEEAVGWVRTLLKLGAPLSDVAITGPGEPLANDRTFEVLRAIKREFPDLKLSVSTNGLLLTERLEEIVRAGVRSITITINAVIPEEAEKIYSWVYYKGARYHGRAAADCLSFNQWRGLRNAIDAGLFVKINTVYMPGLNDEEIPYIAWLAGRRGADLQSIVPLIPQGTFCHAEKPSQEMLEVMRDRCEKHLPQERQGISAPVHESNRAMFMG